MRAVAICIITSTLFFSSCKKEKQPEPKGCQATMVNVTTTNETYSHWKMYVDNQFIADVWPMGKLESAHLPGVYVFRYEEQVSTNPRTFTGTEVLQLCKLQVNTIR